MRTVPFRRSLSQFLCLGFCLVALSRCGLNPFSQPSPLQGQFQGTPGTEAHVRGYYYSYSGEQQELFCEVDTSHGQFQCPLPDDLEFAELVVSPMDSARALHALVTTLPPTDAVAVTPLTEIVYQATQVLVAQGVLAVYGADEADRRLREAMGWTSAPGALVFLSSGLNGDPATRCDADDSGCQQAELIDSLGQSAQALGTDLYSLTAALAADFTGGWIFDGLDGAGRPIPLGGGFLPAGTWGQLSQFHPELPPTVNSATQGLAGFEVTGPGFAVTSQQNVPITWSSAAAADYYWLQVGADPACSGVTPVQVQGTTYLWPTLPGDSNYVCLTAVQGDTQLSAANAPYEFDFRQIH